MNKNPSPSIWSSACYSETFPSPAHFPKDPTEVQERVIRLIRHMEWFLREERVRRTGLSTLGKEYT